MSVPTLVTFIVYFILLLSIGFYFYHRSVSIEDYLLGGGLLPGRRNHDD